MAPITRLYWISYLSAVVGLCIALSRIIFAIKRLKNVNFCRAILCKRGLCRHAVSVCLSVCLQRSYILSKRIT